MYNALINLTNFQKKKTANPLSFYKINTTLMWQYIATCCLNKMLYKILFFKPIVINYNLQSKKFHAYKEPNNKVV